MSEIETASMIEVIRNDIRNIRVYCGRYFPFLVIPLSYMRIIATNVIKTAGVDETNTLVIRPDWWVRLPKEEKRFVALHEGLHVSLLHPLRKKGFEPKVYNKAADGKVNDAIREAELPGVAYRYGDEITLDKIARELGNFTVDDLKKMSTEEIATELERRGRDGMRIPQNGKYQEEASDVRRDLLDGEIPGEVVQEGDRSLSECRSGGELEEAWKMILQRARDFAKQAGSMPAGLERIVNEVLEVRPPWHIIVRNGIRNHAREDCSFAYPSRRGDDYPGYYGYRYSIWIPIDTSGSISEEELRLFLGVVKHEARRAEIYVIPWDAEAYEVLRADKPADVAKKVAPKMRGGGGTVIAPVLRKVAKLMRPGDAVIILTDGEIFDAEEDETKQLFRKVASKACFSMLAYTHKRVEPPGFTAARLDLKSHPHPLLRWEQG